MQQIYWHLSILCSVVSADGSLEKSTMNFCSKTQSFETYPGSKKASGYALNDKPSILHDARGFRKLELDRNHPTLVILYLYA